MELNEQQRAWADSYIGSQMRASSGGGLTHEKGTVLSWTPSHRGNGVWFYISGPNQEWGRKRYRQFPGRLKPQLSSPVTGTVTGRFDASKPNLSNIPPIRREMETAEKPKGIRRDPLVVAYLQEVGFDVEGLPSEEEDHYSRAVSIIAAALDFAFDAVDMLGGKEGMILVDVARALVNGDPYVGGDHWDFETAEDQAKEEVAQVS